MNSSSLRCVFASSATPLRFVSLLCPPPSSGLSFGNRQALEPDKQLTLNELIARIQEKHPYFNDGVYLLPSWGLDAICCGAQPCSGLCPCCSVSFLVLCLQRREFARHGDMEGFFAHNAQHQDQGLRKDYQGRQWQEGDSSSLSLRSRSFLYPSPSFATPFPSGFLSRSLASQLLLSDRPLPSLAVIDMDKPCR